MLTPTLICPAIPAIGSAISKHFMDGIKLDLVETNGEEPVADVSNNREDSYHKLNSAQRDDKRRETTDQMHRSGKIEGS